jgi:RNA polymerase sigma-70 factor (ECF subfamily)
MIFINQEAAAENILHSTESSDGKDLVAAARSGSSAAFDELRRIYGPRIYRKVLSITNSREDAEDALQDAFLQAYRALPRFEERCCFSTWMTRIAINSALMILRKRRRRSEVSLDASSETGTSAVVFEFVDARPGPERICVDRQKYASVLHCISRMQPRIREVIEMQTTRNYSIKEIARTIGVSEAAVKSRLSRGRRMLASAGVSSR